MNRHWERQSLEIRRFSLTLRLGKGSAIIALMVERLENSRIDPWSLDSALRILASRSEEDRKEVALIWRRSADKLPPSPARTVGVGIAVGVAATGAIKDRVYDPVWLLWR